MLRFIIRDDDESGPCNVGGNVETRFRTMDLDVPELERWLSSAPAYVRRSLLGCEVLNETSGTHSAEVTFEEGA